MPLALGAGVRIELLDASEPGASGSEEVHASAWICESALDWLLSWGLRPSGLLAGGSGASGLESGPDSAGIHVVEIIVGLTKGNCRGSGSTAFPQLASIR